MTNTKPNRSQSNVSRETRREMTVLRRFAPVRKPWVIAINVRAWLAVRNGLRVDDYLRGRKGVHELTAAPDDAQLPSIVDVSSGQIEVRHNPCYQDPASLAKSKDRAPIPNLRAMRSLPTREPSARMMQRRIADAIEQLKCARSAYTEVAQREPISAGATASRGAPAPRPCMPSILPMLAWGAAAALVMGSEGFQFAHPMLNATGVDSRPPKWRPSARCVVRNSGWQRRSELEVDNE